MASNERLFKVDDLKTFSNGILEKLGLPKERAQIITDSLLCGELRGVSSHGVIRLTNYVNRVEKGVMDAKAPVTKERDHQATALLNANNGFGQLAGYDAMKLAIEKAKAFGIGMVGVSNSNHFGVTAYYPMLTLDENMIGVVLTNASPAMAYFRTKEPILGTNPLAITVPAGKHEAIVLDMATSVVARGKIRLSALMGKKIPLGWALDSEGHPTEDPEAALKGSLEPIANIKGVALSLIIDLMCGVMTNTSLLGEVKTVTDTSGPAKTGHFFTAIDISKFIDLGLFKANVDHVIDTLKAQTSIDGGTVYMPGELEAIATKRRLEEGIPLTEEVVAELNKVASRYGASILK